MGGCDRRHTLGLPWPHHYDRWLITSDSTSCSRRSPGKRAIDPRASIWYQHSAPPRYRTVIVSFLRRSQAGKCLQRRPFGTCARGPAAGVGILTCLHTKVVDGELAFCSGSLGMTLS